MSKFLVSFNGEKCKGCELCASVCPKHLPAPGKTMNSKGYFIMEIADMDSCVGCQSCALICPDGAISIWKEED